MPSADRYFSLIWACLLFWYNWWKQKFLLSLVLCLLFERNLSCVYFSNTPGTIAIRGLPRLSAGCMGQPPSIRLLILGCTFHVQASSSLADGTECLRSLPELTKNEVTYRIRSSSVPLAYTQRTSHKAWLRTPTYRFQGRLQTIFLIFLALYSPWCHNVMASRSFRPVLACASGWDRSLRS